MKDELAHALRTTHRVFRRRQEAEDALRKALREGTPEDVVRCARALFGYEGDSEGDERASDRAATGK